MNRAECDFDHRYAGGFEELSRQQGQSPHSSRRAVNQADRSSLVGNHTTPRVRIGRRLTCEARDCDVIGTGYSKGRIPWPMAASRDCRMQ
ncbi:MAG TPA: hypothetical protein VHR66_20270 [Gemmataceae bacterium]|jgi:hypothetical protein|nr:hypothetical protein [Gemmataceae bacterium]